jgi:hypothetical protein
MSTHAYTSELFKEIKVETNDPNASLITLTMKARVVEAMRVTPRIVNFGRIGQNQAESREITVENTGKKAFKVTKITASAPSQTTLTVTPNDPFSLKPGESRKLVVKLSTGNATGFLDDSVTLETDLPNLPQKKIYMHVEVRDKQKTGQ